MKDSGGLFKNIFLLSFSLLLLLLLCEISYRFYEFYFYKRQLRKLDQSILEPLPNEPLLQYKLKPNGRFLLADKILYKINSHGLRDYDFPLDKGKSYRIIILGDSNTFGWGVELENTYPKILETLLRERRINAQVINAGIYGYNTQQEALFLRKEILKLSPDLVIVAFLANDTVAQGVVPMHPFVKHCESYYHLWFFEFLKSRINRAINKDNKNKIGYNEREADFYPLKVKLANPNVSYEEAFSDNFLGWRKCKESLLDIKRSSKEKEFDLYLIILPIFNEDFVNYRLTWIHEKVRLYSESIGIQTSDFYRYFRNLDNASLQNLEINDKGHPNALGHKIIAEKLFFELENIPRIKSNLDKFRR